MVISIPTVLDPSMAPDGKHVVHAYTAGNEPYDLFKGLDRKSPKYQVRNRGADGGSEEGGVGRGCWGRGDGSKEGLTEKRRVQSMA